MVSAISRPGADRPVALVTGGSRRVGAAICRAFAGVGFDLLTTHHASAEDADAVIHSLQSMGVAARTEALDLADIGAVETFAAHVRESLPRLDVLVHNAATYDQTPLDSFDPAAALRQHTVNAIAPALLTARLAPMLARSEIPGGGSVLAMCDIHALGRPRRSHLAYAMSKAALAEMVRTLARELAPNIRVNGVAPGVVAFPDAGPESDPALQERYLARVPLARAGTPEDAAEAVRWLALDARYTTGQIIRIDGGRWLT